MARRSDNIERLTTEAEARAALKDATVEQVLADPELLALVNRACDALGLAEDAGVADVLDEVQALEARR